METFSASLALCAGNSPVPVNSPHKGQWRGALMFFLICAWINDWVNNREAGDLRRHRGHYDVSVMTWRTDARSIHGGHLFWYPSGQTDGLVLVRFKSDPLAAFTFRAQRGTLAALGTKKAARGSDLNRIRLVQERRNSSVLAMELCLSCTNPSRWHLSFLPVFHCLWRHCFIMQCLHDFFSTWCQIFGYRTKWNDQTTFSQMRMSSMV